MRKLITLSLLSFSLLATAQTHVLDVNTKKLGAPVQPTMYGIFFEDINYAADGGLYAEMVKNRSFEFPQHLMGWRAYGNFELRNDGVPLTRTHTTFVSAIPVTATSTQVLRMKVSSALPSKRELPTASLSGHAAQRADRLYSR